MSKNDSPTDGDAQSENPLLELPSDKQQELINAVIDADDEAGDTSRTKELRSAATGFKSSRREVLGALLGGGLVGAGAYEASTGSARAASNEVGQIGEPGNLVDVYGEDVSAVSVDTEGVDNSDYHETVVSGSVSGTTGLDLSSSNVFSHTVTGDTTFKFNNPSSSPVGNSFTLIVEQDGTGGHSITWPSAAEWPNGSTPSLSTSANAKHMLGFVSPDGGNTWIGLVSARDIA